MAAPGDFRSDEKEILRVRAWLRSAKPWELRGPLLEWGLSRAREVILLEGAFDSDTVVWLCRSAPHLIPTLSLNEGLGPAAVDHLAYWGWDLLLQEKKEGPAILQNLQSRGHSLPARILSDIQIRAVRCTPDNDMLGILLRAPSMTPESLLRLWEAHRDCKECSVAIGRQCAERNPPLFRTILRSHPDPRLLALPGLTVDLLREITRDAAADYGRQRQLLECLLARADVRRDPEAREAIGRIPEARYKTNLSADADEQECHLLLDWLTRFSPFEALKVMEQASKAARPEHLVELLSSDSELIRQRAMLLVPRLVAPEGA
jgi:hypothetical protein